MTKNEKGKFFPYIVAIAVSIYLSTQLITLASTVNIGVTLQEVSQKQKSIFEFLINESLENAARVSTYPNIINTGENYKTDLLHILSFNKNIKIYDVVFFDLEGNLISSNYEGFSSFQSIFSNIRPESILEPTVQNIRYSELYNDNVIDMLLPVFENGKIVGLMWQVESFERIDSAMKNVSILSTGESYIIDSTGKVLTGLKHVNIATSPITLRNNALVESSLNGFEKHPYLDYNYESVFGYHTLLNLNGWKLIVEVHENEVVNTAGKINDFLVSSITLLLATSKLLEPIFKNLIFRKKLKSESSYNLYSPSNPPDTIIYNIKSYIKKWKLVIFYKRYNSFLNVLFLVLFCIISVISIGKVKTNNDIQNSLDLSNQVNRRLISYYINETRSNFYASNRTITEFSSLDLHLFLDRVEQTNTNLLNIILLDENNLTYYNSTGSKYNAVYANQSIKNNNTLYNFTGISDIFYDENYNQYVYYISSSVLDNKTNKWYTSIGVVSIDNLLSILLSNEVYSSKIITILNKDKILYSNKYTQKEIPNYKYDNLRRILYTDSLNHNTIFDINKYKNIDGVDVFGSYSKINMNEVLVYGSYSPLTNTDWELLYEEPVSVAKSRIFKGSIDLFIGLSYQYIRNVIDSIT